MIHRGWCGATRPSNCRISMVRGCQRALALAIGRVLSTDVQSVANQRRGALTIGSASVELAQDGAPCRFDLDTGQAEVPATGGGFTIAVTAMPGCG